MWFKVRELAHDLFHVIEPNHVSFYILRNKDKALLIDSGLGLVPNQFKQILEDLSVKTFNVLATHFHCDHVGSNHLAEKVFVNYKEWEKYQRLHDENQIFSYFKLLEAYKEWPSSVTSQTIDFSSKVMPVEEGKIVIEGHELESVPTPGHTCGHMAYISHKHRSIFVGDLLYDGLLFINLPDSDFDSYLGSLEKIWKINQRLKFTLLPSHNTIPLPAEYLPKVIEVFHKIKSGVLKGSEISKNSIFESSLQFSFNGVKVQISRDKL